MMISSTLPREGKTLTAANIALTLSESYRRRVLLVDADLRRPSIHQVFGIPNVVGLADALRVPGARLPCVEISETLSVLPSGRIGDSPIAVLSSDLLRTLVADAAEQFDWVLLDTPPVAMLTDAHLVARAVDAVLFVIRAGTTPYTLVQRSLAEIGADRIVGTVLNGVDERDLAVHGYYRSHYGGEA
jgi:capsular exopolysaccharide synthesis family protein